MGGQEGGRGGNVVRRRYITAHAPSGSRALGSAPPGCQRGRVVVVRNDRRRQRERASVGTRGGLSTRGAMPGWPGASPDPTEGRGPVPRSPSALEKTVI